MSEKTIEIKGRQISEQTIVEALKAHCGFEETTIFDVEKLRIVKRTSGMFPVAIAVRSTRNSLTPESDNGLTKDYIFGLFSKSDAQKVVENLQKVIDNI